MRRLAGGSGTSYTITRTGGVCHRAVPVAYAARSLMIRAALFDFDGTLADSFAAITASTNHVREATGCRRCPRPWSAGTSGSGWPTCLAHSSRTHRPRKPWPATGAPPHRHVHRDAADARGGGDDPRTGARRAAGGVQQQARRVHPATGRSLGLGPYFAAVLGPDDVGGRAKPDPAMLLEGLRRLGVSAAEAVYVGDMAVDVQTAKAAGMPVWLVPGGAVGRSRWPPGRRTLTGFDQLLDRLVGLGLIFVIFLLP